MTEDDFALAAVACADQAGVDAATQEQIRLLIEASRRRDADVRARIAATPTRAQIEDVMGRGDAFTRAVCHRLLIGSVTPLCWSLLEPARYSAVMAMTVEQMHEHVMREARP